VSRDELSILLAVLHLCSKPIGDVALRGEDVGVTYLTGRVDDVEDEGITSSELSFEGKDGMNMGLPICVIFDSDGIGSEWDSGN